MIVHFVKHCINVFKINIGRSEIAYVINLPYDRRLKKAITGETDGRTFEQNV